MHKAWRHGDFPSVLSQVLLLAAYFLLLRRPPDRTRQLLKAGLDIRSRDSLLAASEMLRCGGC